MKLHTRYSIFLLPAMVLLSVLGWWLFGAFSARGMTDDLLAWLAELPVVTCFAMASLIAAMVAMQATGMNIDNEARAKLLRAAAAGDRNAERVLWHESLCWFAMFGMAALYFVPAR